MAKTKTTPYDTVDYLKTEEESALYFEAYLDEAGDDPAFIAKALGDIAHGGEVALRNRVQRGLEACIRLHRQESEKPGPKTKTVHAYLVWLASTDRQNRAQ